MCVEDLKEFQGIHAPGKAVEGQLKAPFRKLVLSEESNCVFSAIERNGSSAYITEDAKDIEQYIEACRVFSSRQRKFASEEEGFSETRKIVSGLSSNLDKQRLADAFFHAERVYWASRNMAARVQKTRQDELGLGWGNHDHHTFRSSRLNFQALIGIFELLGLKA